jgi:hypothetical protein
MNRCFPAFLAMLGFAISPAVQSAPILQITIDEPLRGRAVVSGDVERDVSQTYALSAVGRFWSYESVIIVLEDTPGEFVSIAAFAKHLVAPHAGETAPGLELGTAAMLARTPAGGVPDLSGARVTRDELIHPGSDKGHSDRLVMTLDDLNGGGAGFMRGGQLSVRLDVRHIPAPAAIALFGLGLAGLAAAQCVQLSPRPKRKLSA